MNTHHQLILDSERSFAVMSDDTDFALFDLQEERTEDFKANVLIRGFSYCGTIGFRRGTLAVALEDGTNVAARMIMSCAALEAVQRVTGPLRPPKWGDELSWLTRLYSLPDPRT